MTRRVLAIASGGGHWQQLMALRPAYDRHKVTYLTTLPGLAEAFDVAPAHVVPDCNRNEPARALRCVFVLVWHVVRQRPHVVISTGALPGVIALALGRCVGARTIWIDSIANAEEMSASGRLARRFAHAWFSQWPEVARATGARYDGALL